MFIKTTTHKRIVAEKDAEIAGLMKRLERFVLAHNHTSALLQSAERRNGELRRQLAPFTTPRARDSRGRFIKDQ